MDPLVTAEALAGYLQRDLDRYTADLSVAGASALVRSYCGWSISQEATTMTVDGTGTNVLSLPTLQLNSAAVTIDGTLQDASTYTLARRGQLRMLNGGVWPAGFDNVTADVDHGYVIIPDDVQLIVCAVAARYYSNPDSLRSKASGDDSKVYSSVIINVDFTEMMVRLLGPYVVGGRP